MKPHTQLRQKALNAYRAAKVPGIHANNLYGDGNVNASERVVSIF